jgi:RNA polymerase sigma-70 factor (ECF subfamily)
VRRAGTPLEGAPEPEVAADALDTLIADERSRRLWQQVAKLSSGERTAVLLYYRDELSVGDIARGLGVTTGTVKTLLFRARRRLRERVTPQETSA